MERCVRLISVFSLVICSLVPDHSMATAMTPHDVAYPPYVSVCVRGDKSASHSCMSIRALWLFAAPLRPGRLSQRPLHCIETRVSDMHTHATASGPHS
ncbi:hypothetical protein VTK73DRAFT_3989 [Phialemonium thermophilum]|uniref:Secreted protein n=1 Tax=Phialemonium thermophilum TaxID=223376 RepID=A0ABR3VD61_9PEZI